MRAQAPLPYRRIWIVSVLMPAVLTEAMLRWPQLSWPGWIEAPLGVGLLVAATPFGGAHNHLPWLRVTLLAAGFNAALWGSLLAAATCAGFAIARPGR
jgi:hypothetical protein